MITTAGRGGVQLVSVHSFTQLDFASKLRGRIAHVMAKNPSVAMVSGMK